MRRIPVVPARGCAEVALGNYTIRPFSSVELACAVRQPGPFARVLWESGALYQMSHWKLDISHFILHTSHYILRTPHTPTLHTSFHLILSHLSSSHLISAHLFSPHLSLYVIQVLLNYAHLIEALLNLLSSSVRQKAFTVREKLLWTQ